jgi:hypothetical protein
MTGKAEPLPSVQLSKSNPVSGSHHPRTTATCRAARTFRGMSWISDLFLKGAG